MLFKSIISLMISYIRQNQGEKKENRKIQKGKRLYIKVKIGIVVVQFKCGNTSLLHNLLSSFSLPPFPISIPYIYHSLHFHLVFSSPDSSPSSQLIPYLIPLLSLNYSLQPPSPSHASNHSQTFQFKCFTDHKDCRHPYNQLSDQSGKI